MDINFERKIDELQKLVSKYDTESFAGAFAYFIKKRPDPFAEIDLNKFESKLRDFLYLIALNAFAEKKSSEKFELPFKEMGLIAETLNEIKDNNRIKKITDYTTESVIHEMAFRNHFDNGVLSYVEQDLERVRRLFAPFDGRIIGEFELDIDFLVEVFKEIELITVLKFKYIMEFSHKKEFVEFHERVHSKRMGFSESFDLLPEDIQDAFFSFQDKTYAYLIFTAEDLYRRLDKKMVDRFLQLFSIVPKPDTAIRYYAAESPFELRPILKLPEGNYLNLYGKQIPISIYRQLCAGLSKDGKLKEKLLRHREKSLEKKVAELFKSFFPARESFFYEKYFIEKNFEQDLLIIYKGAAIIVETKASKLRVPFREVERAIPRLKSDFKDSIQYGFSQCLRVEDYFYDSIPFDIQDAKGNVLYTVHPGKIHSVYSIIVTIERFGSLQTDLKLMLEKDERIDYPWAVYIDDLEVFLVALKKSIKGAAGQFLNYLKFRREMHGRMYAIDELDIAATFLKNSSKFRWYSNAEKSFLTFSPYEQGYFDELYWANQLHFGEKPLPEDFYRFGIPV